ncbi:MAG: CRISPR-associated protein Cas5 [candidate division KSB1 bacterium]|nr:CRISPR-associated protein Cas5 [candidate division KSB1 bacterium]
MRERIVIFDWKGFFAHFRQFDANSSSLSHSIPPPTAISGMVAGLLGMERDTYYAELNRENLQIAVQLKSTPRKIMQTINYIFAKSPTELNQASKHTQIPFELVVSDRFPKAPLHYRIYLRFADETLAKTFLQTLQNRQLKYLPYLGSAPFGSWIDWAGHPDEVEELATDRPLIIDSTTDLQSVEMRTLSLEPIDGKTPAIFREHMRREFLPGREPGPMIDIIWEKNRQKIKAQFKQPVYRLKIGEEIRQICFC